MSQIPSTILWQWEHYSNNIFSKLNASLKLTIVQNFILQYDGQLLKKKIDKEEKIPPKHCTYLQM